MSYFLSWGWRLSLIMVFYVVGFTATAGLAADDTLSRIKRGGQLYDKWYAGQSPPEESHALYPESGRKQGSTTWRCKECHGWDYVGAGGRYAKGSHYTGIGGVLQARGEPATELAASLARGEHDFSSVLTEHDLQSLVDFLHRGTMDVSTAIGEDGKALGIAKAGEPLYGRHCASCHGNDGNSLDFKGKKAGIQGVGWLARDNPQESLHKIRWGHPGSDMPSMVIDADLSAEQVSDLLAYAQQLP